jgi:hypothetical protein
VLIVVSGHSRGVGKTSLVEAVVRAFPTYNFSTLKISGHRHGSADGLHSAREDTGPRGARLVAAGARSAWLLHADTESLTLALPAFEELLSTAPNWIVESNRLVAYLQPDLLLFVCHPEIADWKASADACLAGCDAVVLRSAAWAERIVGRVIPKRASRLFQPEPGVLAEESSQWLAWRIQTICSSRGSIRFRSSLTATGKEPLAHDRQAVV